MRRLFDLHLVIGVCLMCVGLWAHLRPSQLLDVVLTQAEIQDQAKADATLKLLQRGAGNDSAWLFWSGAVLTATSLWGLAVHRVASINARRE